MKKIYLPDSKSFSAEKHGFHLVSPSPWPFLTSVGLFQIMVYTLLLFHGFETSNIVFFLSFSFLFVVIGMWFRDIVMESTFQGFHTSSVQRGLRYGMILFLMSETMFFFGFFWCFFYMSMSPSMWMGCTWPPVGIEPLNPFMLPLLNTIMLVSSGISANFSHKSMLWKYGRNDVTLGLVVSMLLGVAFTCFQLWEYSLASFSMNDGMYGSMFYVATGFHGLHVMMGTMALMVCLISHLNYHFQLEHHLGFEFSLWYWHFVDVIWMFLYMFMYCWGYSF